MTRYRALLETLRRSFPQPVSDQVHDAYFAFTILRALDQVDALKGQAPILGQPTSPDLAGAAAACDLPLDGKSLEAVVPELIRYLEGMVLWGHPRCQLNVVPPPSIASIVGVLLPSTYNPNLVSEESSHRVAEIELRVAAMAAGLVGYDPTESAGVFTFGGTGGMLYGMKIGLEKALPGTFRHGLREPVCVLASDRSHYGARSVAAWLGIGEENVIAVPTHADNSIRLDALDAAAREALADGRRIACIVATMGSTDAFGLDDLAGMRAWRDRLATEERLDYRPHIHADAVIGWAWSVFNDYDFQHNELGFRGRTLRALAAAQYRVGHLQLADSLGIDFHKTGYCPYISSLFLVRERKDFSLVARSRATMPYLFQVGEYHPGMFTLETSRSGTGPMAALANLLLFGKQGLRTLLGHAVEMAETLREQIEAHPDVTVLNDQNVGPVTLFRVYPHGTDTFTIKDRERCDAGHRATLARHNDYNRRIFERVHAEALQGHGVALSLTDCYRQNDFGDPIVALKSYVLSPFADESEMASILRHVLAAREAVEEEDRSGRDA